MTVQTMDVPEIGTVWLITGYEEARAALSDRASHATTVKRRLIARFPDLRLATTELQWRPNPMIRGLVALPVLTGTRPSA